MLTELENSIILSQVTSKGILLIKKTSMYLFTFNASVSKVSSAGLNASYGKLDCAESDVCICTIYIRIYIYLV